MPINMIYIWSSFSFWYLKLMLFQNTFWYNKISLVAPSAMPCGSLVVRPCHRYPLLARWFSINLLKLKRITLIVWWHNRKPVYFCLKPPYFAHLVSNPYWHISYMKALPKIELCCDFPSNINYACTTRRVYKCLSLPLRCKRSYRGQ